MTVLNIKKLKLCKFSLWFIIALILINIFLWIKYDKSNELNSRYYSNMEKLHIYRNTLSTQTLFNNNIINDNELIISNKNDTISIKDLIDGYPKLIVILSELSCNTCVDSLIKRLQNIQITEALSQNLCFISDFRDRGQAIKFRRVNNLGSDLYRLLSKNQIFDKQNELTPPYIFLIDSDLKIKHLFIPDILIEENDLMNYLQIIYNKYF